MQDNSGSIIVDKIRAFTSLGNKKILEIGCGKGRITGLLADYSKNLIAIDPDFIKIKIAKENVSGVPFQLGSGEDLAFSTASFDLVIFTLSLHHQDSASAISEAARVLKTDGEILIIEPTIDGEIQQVFSLLNDENQELINAQKAIQNSGLSLEKSEIFNATWMFDNKKDLCQSVFDLYNKPFDNRTAVEIITLIGDRSEDEPIELVDELVIQRIRK